MTKSKAVIKKYGNRRLYDTGASRYVNLEDIARAIRQGADVEVVNARTGKDVTRVILTQIIVEETKDDATGLPLQLLHQLVRASDRAAHDFLSWYVGAALELFQKAQDTVRTRLTEAKQTVVSPLESLRQLLAGVPWPPPRDDAEVEQLRHRVEELEATVARYRKRAKAKRKQP
jgi:polyhydroxyalkanoate synthesis repressor PhaR